MERQAQLLRSFLTQFDSKEATAAHEDGAYAVEFLKLKRQSTKYRTEKTYSTKAADRQENVRKNRYKDIVPFDQSRVKLSLNTSKNDTDYINGNFIRGVFGPTEYIATQGPLPHTVVDFWRMLWEYNVQVIVMACREFEMGRKKCERYWPETLVDVFVCEPFIINCESEENKGDYLIRILKVTFKNSCRVLKQLHYMNWPDHGIPDSIPPILEMLQDMRVFQERDDVPICIHCSAGCGRTGVLCVIDYTWNLLKKQMIPNDFDIYNLVQDMRTQRPSIVQTKEQYELVYRAITFLFRNHLQMLEASSKQKEVPAAPPPIPENTDSDVSDFSESEGEPVVENTLHLPYDLRCQEKEVPKQFSNCVATNAVPQPLPPHLQPTSTSNPKCTLTHKLNIMTKWAKISPKVPVTASNQQKTESGYQKSQITKPHPLQETDLGYQTSQTPNPPLLQQRGHGHHKSQTIEPPPMQPTDLGFRKLQTPFPFPIQERGYDHQTPEHPLQSKDLGYGNSQTLQPPLVLATDLACGNSHILQPPPVKPTDFGLQKGQMPKPPRIQKIDLGCQKFQTTEPPPVQETDLGYQKSQVIEHPFLKQKDIKCHISEPPQIQPPPFGYLKSQIPKPPRHQKSDLGFHKPQILEIATTTQTQHNDQLKSNNHIRPTPVEVSSPYQTHQTEMNNGGASLQASSICLTVEDPYFVSDCYMSPESTEYTEAIPHFMEKPCHIGPTLISKDLNIKLKDKHTGEEVPPPLPERTPESYIMADKDIEMVIDQSLMLVIPPDTFSTSEEASPPSPAPPLPERTPESFEMAKDEDLLQNAVQEKPQETVLRVRKSSEWSGNSTLDVPDFRRSWSRSKSLKARLSLNVPVHFQPFAPFHNPSPEPPKSLTPPPPERTPDSFLIDAPVAQALSSFTPPLPRRTPESFIISKDEDQRNSAPCQGDSTQHRQRLGMSSEWAGNSQLMAVPDMMNRSKSVRVKSSKQEALSVVSLPDLNTGASAEPALSREQDQSSLECRPPAATQPLSKKGRTKSLKLWKGKQKKKEAPESAAVPPNHASSGFIFSFGTRFGKPKGPRDQPETWV